MHTVWIRDVHNVCVDDLFAAIAEVHLDLRGA